MNVWHSSHLYKLWVVGGLIGIVAFAVIGGLSDPSNQDFIFYLIPVIAIWVGGIFLLQWRAVQKDARERPATAEPAAGLVRWNIIFGAVLCVAIFAGVFLFYADVGGTLYPLGESGPGFPVVLLPAIALVIYGALRTLHLLREISRGGADGGPTDFEGPTDIQAPERPGSRGRSD